MEVVKEEETPLEANDEALHFDDSGLEEPEVHADALEYHPEPSSNLAAVEDTPVVSVSSASRTVVPSLMDSNLKSSLAAQSPSVRSKPKVS